MDSLTRQNTTAGGSAGDQEVAAMRDEIVIGVWMDTLPPAIEQDLKARASSTGTWYDDLTGLQNQYMTALNVLAQAGWTPTEPLPGLVSDDNKQQAIAIAKTLVARDTA